MITTHRTVLALSCLNGEFKAGIFRRGALSGGWERPGPVDDFGNFAAVVNEAAEKTGFAGEEVALVLAHPRLIDQTVESPPIKGWTLQRFLHRRVQQLKTFEGEPAWSYQPGMSSKAANALRVHVLPKELLDHLIAGCQKADLRLVRVLPTTAVLGAQLKELPLEKDEVALLAAQTGPTTTVVIGRRDGRVALGRVLRSSWNTEPDRVAVDLTRTIGFAEQQTGVAVGSVWLFGPGADAHLPQMQSLLKLPVKLSPVQSTPFYWAEQAGRMPGKTDGNLISVEMREAPQRLRMLAVTGLVLIILLLAALGTAAFTEWRRQSELATIKKIEADIVRWTQSRTEWQQRHADLLRKADLVRIVSEQRPLPVPGWFLGYMGEILPDELLLTELRVRRTNELWSVYMAGAAQPTTNSASSVLFQEAFAALTNSLATGPFELSLTRSAPVDIAPLDVPLADSDIAATVGLPKAKQHTFVIEGVIR